MQALIEKQVRKEKKGSNGQEQHAEVVPSRRKSSVITSITNPMKSVKIEDICATPAKPKEIKKMLASGDYVRRVLHRTGSSSSSKTKTN